MHLRRGRVPMPGSQNRPSINGEDVVLTDYDVVLTDYTDAIAAGFSDTYRLLMDSRAELLGADGLLGMFAGDEIRVIVRPTRIYAFLLEESFHPDLLRNALDRDRHFDVFGCLLSVSLIWPK